MPDAIRVQIQGLPQLREKFSELSDRGQRAALRRAFRVAGNMVRDEARARVPVRTGRLRRSINVNVRLGRHDGEATIGYRKTVFWGGFVELGTRKMRARPYLQPALEENAQRIVQEFADAMNEAIDRVKAKGG